MCSCSLKLNHGADFHASIYYNLGSVFTAPAFISITFFHLTQDQSRLRCGNKAT